MKKMEYYVIIVLLLLCACNVVKGVSSSFIDSVVQAGNSVLSTLESSFGFVLHRTTTYQKSKTQLEQIYLTLNPPSFNESNPVDLYNLGMFHYDSSTGDSYHNLSLALQYVNQSASLGLPVAQHTLGLWYSHGLEAVLDRNEAAAVVQFYFSSLGGYAPSSAALGYRHFYGYNVPQSCTTSLRYYKFAADDTMKTLLVNHLYFSTWRKPFRLGNKNVMSLEERYNQFEYLATSSSSSSYYAVQRAIAVIKRSLISNEDMSHVNRAINVLRHYKDVEDNALVFLGHLYTHRNTTFSRLDLKSIDTNVTRGVEYYRTALLHGSEEASYGLGLVYRYILKNNDKAFEYFSSAATSAGHVDAIYRLGLMLEEEGSDIIGAYSRYKTAADTGHTLALFKMARAYERGKAGYEVSCSTAVGYYKRVAEHSRRHYVILHDALEWYSLSNTHGRAIQLYQSVAEEGVEIAQSNLGLVLLLKNNDNDEYRVQMLERASRQGNTKSRVALGDYYFDQKAYGKSISHYQIASTKNSGQALFNLGYAYEHGYGVPVSSSQAIQYYKLATQREPRAWIATYIASYVCQAKVWYDDTLKNASPKTTSIITSSSNSEENLVHALKFEQQKAYVEVRDATLFSGNSFTLECWINVSPFEDTVVQQVMGQEGVAGMHLVKTPEGIKVKAGYYPDEEGLLSKMVLSHSKWYHVAVVKHKAYIAIYVDGKMSGVKKYRGDIRKAKGGNSLENSCFYIGAKEGEDEFFIGKIANARVWSDAKVPEDINLLMRTMSPVIQDKSSLKYGLQLESLSDRRPADDNSVEQLVPTATGSQLVLLIRRPTVVQEELGIFPKKSHNPN